MEIVTVQDGEESQQRRHEDKGNQGKVESHSSTLTEGSNDSTTSLLDTTRDFLYRCSKAESRKLWIPVALAFLIAFGMGALGAFLFTKYNKELAELSTWLRESGPLAFLYYGLIVIFAIVFCLPITLLEIIGGTIFGLGAGFAVSFTAKTLGCTLSFLIGRCLRSQG